MTFIKEKIDFIYQNILLFHFKALSLRILNERLKNTPTSITIFLETSAFIPFHVSISTIATSSRQFPNIIFLFYNNVRTYTYAQARISLLFL